MEKLPLVSILMTSYNREKYIAEAIESVQASTYSNWELIIVDDQSKDKTVEIAKSYAEKDIRIRIYINEENLGDYPNRNKAASYATGKYLKYVDADDLIYPWALEILVTCMEKYPESALGLCSLNQDNKKIFPILLTPEEAYKYHYRGSGLFHKAPLSSIIRRDIFEKVGGFKNIRMAGDFEMWNRICKAWPVLLLPQGMVWYRMHGEQEMKDYRKYILVYEKIKRDNIKSDDVPLNFLDKTDIVKYQKRKLSKALVKSFLKLDLANFVICFKSLIIWNK